MMDFTPEMMGFTPKLIDFSSKNVGYFTQVWDQPPEGVATSERLDAARTRAKAMSALDSYA